MRAIIWIFEFTVSVLILWIIPTNIRLRLNGSDRSVLRLKSYEKLKETLSKRAYPAVF